MRRRLRHAGQHPGTTNATVSASRSAPPRPSPPRRRLNMAVQPKPSGDGAPVGRRALLGMLAAGAAGLAGAPYLQRGWEGFLGAASQVDATGLTGLLPNPGGFRYY